MQAQLGEVLAQLTSDEIIDDTLSSGAARPAQVYSRRCSPSLALG
jgi:hypothetical protein